MFPSAGYFRSANCPFFIHGLCHRPYCHFRHAKPGHGSSSKTSIKSCLKSKTTATKTECTDNSIHVSQPESATETNSAGIKSVELGSVLGDDELKNTEKIEPEKAAKTSKTSNKETQKTSPNKTSLSILESLNKLEQAVEEASATLHSAPCSSKKISNLINTSVKEKNTCEKKTLKTAVQTKESTSTKEKTICEKKTLKTAVQTKESTSTKEKTICEKKPLKTAVQTKESTSKIESSTVQTNKDNTVKQQSFTLEISSNNCTELEENSSLEEKQMDFEDSNKIQEGKETKNVNKELGKEVVDTIYKYSNNIKRKHDKIDEGLHHSAKKRKTSCSSDDTPRKSKESKLRNSLVKTPIDAEKETIKKKKGVTKDSIQRKCTEYGQPKKVEESSKTIKTKAAKEELKNMDKGTLDKAEKKAAKVKRQLMDIDFFTLSKKSKLKTQGEVKTAEDKPEKTDQVKLKTLRKQAKPKTSSDIKGHDIKTPEISSKTGGGLKANISIDSLFESDEDKDDSSDSISDSEQDTMDSGTDTLKEIFDNYDPQQGREKRVSTQNTAGTSGVMSVDVSPAKDKNTSPAELQGLGKKKRVAHNASYLVQRKGSNINPIRRLPKDSPSIPAKQPQPTTLERNALQTKRRVAHIPKPTTDTSLPRPRIPTEYGAKVPQNLRQRYLDKIIDENLRLYATEKEAFDRGVEEERSIYQRATRRPMYLNLCCNAIKVLRSKPTPDFQTDPDPSPAGMSSATGTTGSSKAMKNSSKEIDPSNLTEEMTYELLSQYIMTEEQLVENGYPRPCPSTPGKVTFKPHRPLPTPSKDPNRRTCCRCGKNYSINDDGTYVRQEDCVYHVGRLFRRRTAGEISSSFQCCGGDASTPGCAVCKFHVCEGKNQTEGFMTTIISPLAGNQKKVFGVDCEMCYTIAGLELTRVTVVDWKLEKIYDTFVKPDNPILDYNTRFSGVTRECLRGVKTSIREVQAVLLSMISKDSILVGHSLESDLLSLKLVHDTVVDTSVVFPHRLGPPYKRALRTLMAEFVKKIIQNNEEGHDSYEDAKASLELMLFKVKEDLKKKPKNKR